MKFIILIFTTFSFFHFDALADDITIANQVRFVVLGKTINHRQSQSGALSLLNHHFFGEIFISDEGTVSNSFIKGPKDVQKPLPFLGDGKVVEVHGDRHLSQDDLDHHFPDGTYYFNFDTPFGNIKNLPATFSKNGEASRNPGPIKVSLFQKGLEVLPYEINANFDLTVKWSEFTSGNSDPNGIIDDLVFVILGDCFGEQLVHSGAPFGDTTYLTYKDKSFTISNEKISSGTPLQISVELAEMDTSTYKSIPIIVTYAATSFLDIYTLGVSSDDEKCPTPPYKMDKGQTDQPDKPE